MKEKKARCEDALAATRAAVDEGIVAGGGISMLRAIAGIESLDLDGDQNTGRNIVREALRSPIKAIAENAGLEGAVVVSQVENGEGNYGFNAAIEEYGDMVEFGVIDPTKVVRSALQNASSIAGLLLTTETLITEIEEPPDFSDMGDHDDYMH